MMILSCVIVYLTFYNILANGCKYIIQTVTDATESPIIMTLKE